MVEKEFENLFNKLQMPVMVCNTNDQLTLAYMNGAARIGFSPHLSLEEVNGKIAATPLNRVLRFANPGLFRIFCDRLRGSGSVEPLQTALLSFQEVGLPATVYASRIIVKGRAYYAIYASTNPGADSCQAVAGLTSMILDISTTSLNADQVIEDILALAGGHIGAGRAYIVEDLSAVYTGMTYEWCAEGVKPFKDELQRLNKREYIHESIMRSSGILLAGNTGDFPEADRRLLEEMGVKSLAFIPLERDDRIFGFLGFNDCLGNRQWSADDLQLMHNIGNVVTGLIGRRNAQRAIESSGDIVQAVTDNLDDLIYISDLDSYEIKFISHSLARAVRKSPAEIIGKPCWSVLHRNLDGPCPFCPIPQVLKREKEGKSGSYVWELHNNKTGKWYMVKDTIVGWVDGFRAHLGTFVDITYRKQYEEHLRRFAATDAMTDVYNRKWGYGKLSDLFLTRHSAETPQTLCFIDVDGLKAVNDRLGHAVGDEMILNTVSVILSCIRKDDFVCRWGGDEFIVFLNCGLDDANRVLDKILFGIEHFNSIGDKAYRLSISTGLVDFAAPFDLLDDLIGEADRLMYDNKVRKKCQRRSEDTNAIAGLEMA